MGVGEGVELAPLAEGLEAAHLAEDELGVVLAELVLLLAVGVQGALPVVQLLVPALLDADLALVPLHRVLEQPRRRLFLSQPNRQKKQTTSNDSTLPQPNEPDENPVAYLLQLVVDRDERLEDLRRRRFVEFGLDTSKSMQVLKVIAID